jgi:outer membrane murein-binding lipoprotein Lpp
MKVFLILYVSCFSCFLHAANENVSAPPQVAAAPAAASLATSNQAQQKMQIYMQHYVPCSQLLYEGFVQTLSSLTPEHQGQLAAGPTYFFPTAVTGTAFVRSIERQYADHGALDGTTLAVVANVHAHTQRYLTAAGHLQGLATEETVRRLENKVNALHKEMEATKKEAAAAVQKLIAPVPKKGAVAVEVVERPVTPPEGTFRGWFARRLKDLF